MLLSFICFKGQRKFEPNIIFGDKCINIRKERAKLEVLVSTRYKETNRFFEA